MPNNVEEPTESNNQVAGDSLAVAKWTLASRLTGFVRVLLVGAVLGATNFGDLFTFANTLPWIMFELAIGALLASLVVPPLVERFDSGGVEAVSDLARNFAGVLLVAFGAVALVVMAVSPLAARLFVSLFGIEGGAATDNYMAAAVPMFIITAPQIVGYGLAFTGVAVQNSMGRFAFPAAVPIIENVVVIAALALYALTFETETALTEVTTGRWLLLAAGSSAGVFSHMALQLWGARRMGVSLMPKAGWKDPAVREIIRLAMPSSGLAVLNGARYILISVATSVVPGGLVAFQMALNFLNVPVALGAKPVAQAMLPQLSRHEANNDPASWREEYQRGMGLAALIAIPAAVAIVALARPLALGTAFGALGSEMGRDLLTVSLIGTGLAVLGDALFQVATPSAYSRRNAIVPLRAYAIRFGLSVAVIALVWALFDGVELVLGVGLAVALGDIVGGVYLDRRIGAGEKTGGYDLRGSLLRSAAAALLAFVPAAVVAGIAVQRWQDPPTSTAVAGVCGLVGLVTYFVARYKMGSEEISALRNSR